MDIQDKLKWAGIAGVILLNGAALVWGASHVYFQVQENTEFKGHLAMKVENLSDRMVSVETTLNSIQQQIRLTRDDIRAMSRDINHINGVAEYTPEGDTVLLAKSTNKTGE